MFTNFGVRHVQDIRATKIVLGHITFANSLQCATHSQLSGGKLEDECCPALHQLFMPLLGAVAYLAHTWMGVVVFISALQRHACKPCLEQVRRLSKLLSWGAEASGQACVQAISRSHLWKRKR